MINKFVQRLLKLGITVELHGNYPWIYLHKVNGQRVTEKLYANHGYTAFILRVDGSYSVPDLHDLFKIIRKYKEL